ncbi:MAG: hypothetical protein GKR91_04935 [Pseudomonadales bacterium]|nr:hypothetical protein [Pseudomonadales bacterium]
MTEYEFYDLLVNFGSTVTEMVAVFISVFVAYIVCVYAVGSKLSTIQSVALSVVYSVFSLFFVFLVYNSLSTLQTMANDYNNIEGDASLGIGAIAPISLLLAWLASIVYMYQVRRNRTNQNSADGA